jgi:DNA-binding beta-propeller fold protein YncE
MRPSSTSALRWFKAALVATVFALINTSVLAATESVNVFTLNVGSSSASLANAVLFDGKSIWVAVQNPEGGALEKRTVTGDVLAATQVGQTPIELAFDGQNIWVTNYTSSTVSVVNESGTLLKTISIPSAMPEGITFDGKYIWTANNGPGANSVTKIDAAAMSIVNTYSVGLGPDGVAFDGTNVWVTNSLNNSVWQIDRNSGAYLAGYPTGLFPLAIVFDGTNMWIGNGTGVNVGSAVVGPGSLSKIRVSDGADLGTFGVGNHVRGLVYDGTSIWACNGNDNTVSRLRTGGVALLGTYPTGKSPRAIAFDGTNAWVANSGENTVTIISTAGAGGGPAQLAAFGPSKPAGSVGGSPVPLVDRPYKGRSLPGDTRAARTPPKVVTVRSVVQGNSVASMVNMLLGDD